MSDHHDRRIFPSINRNKWRRNPQVKSAWLVIFPPGNSQSIFNVNMDSKLAWNTLFFYLRLLTRAERECLHVSICLLLSLRKEDDEVEWMRGGWCDSGEKAFIHPHQLHLLLHSPILDVSLSFPAQTINYHRRRLPDTHQKSSLIHF